jgi:hypothetical protein
MPVGVPHRIWQFTISDLAIIRIRKWNDHCTGFTQVERMRCPVVISKSCRHLDSRRWFEVLPSIRSLSLSRMLTHRDNCPWHISEREHLLRPPTSDRFTVEVKAFLIFLPVVPKTDNLEVWPESFPPVRKGRRAYACA